MERESFLMNMSVGREAATAAAAAAAACDVCLKAKTSGVDDGFHLCVHDAVTVGFRSPAGPISRPARNSGENGP
uniref:Uncharacterized protein n=2 Tax=Cajanus cajan TaxID=3821 RepID=A0A151RJZ0_CAJCA|nr:hypothetical protein KK1_035705 [Cajanus cajan]